MKTLMTTTAGMLVAFGTAAFAQSIDVNGAVAQGSSVTLPSVTATSAGYLVIHQVQDGQPVVPQSIGHTAVMAGENADVSVTTDMALEPGMSYAAMLHDETNGNDTYDFGEGSTEVDTPTMANGAPVVKVFRVGTPAGMESEGGMNSGEMQPEGGMEPAEGEMMEGDAPMGESGATAQ
ncbi:hypothetical protein FP2506_07381 [Fulvimarina pelagi HTCC2506]|uniref:DUF7282 domain-containing protein n=1 Tax=Fulvimarina pelagi HTCC2506 TaxID=314231 RepID=Q0G6S0_9HYPH|nr:hypothetical protein [Fulvimarina pelagi]EAU42644.1 hypothetical protein FP2506_07381 [Fulvimarina pelagi HTCC2506]